MTCWSGAPGAQLGQAQGAQKQREFSCFGALSPVSPSVLKGKNSVPKNLQIAYLNMQWHNYDYKSSTGESRVVEGRQGKISLSEKTCYLRTEVLPVVTQQETPKKQAPATNSNQLESADTLLSKWWSEASQHFQNTQNHSKPVVFGIFCQWNPQYDPGGKSYPEMTLVTWSHGPILKDDRVEN